MVNTRHNGIKLIMISQQFHEFLKCNNQGLKAMTRYDMIRYDTIRYDAIQYVAMGRIQYDAKIIWYDAI